jgi:hypothetical protein
MMRGIVVIVGIKSMEMGVRKINKLWKARAPRVHSATSNEVKCRLMATHYLNRTRGQAGDAGARYFFGHVDIAGIELQKYSCVVKWCTIYTSASSGQVSSRKAVPTHPEQDLE